MFLKKINILILSVAVMLLAGACSSKFAKLQKTGTTDQKYKAAMAYYKAASYYKANILFEEIIPLLKGDSLAESAQFYNAYCSYQQKQYTMSSYLFKNFYSTYARSPFAEEAYYMYAYSMYKDSPNFDLDQTNTITAIDALQTFLDTFPDSEYAKKCTENIQDLRERLELKAFEKAKLYFKTRSPSVAFGNYKAAIVAFENFQKDYPDSKYLEDISFTKLQTQFEYAGISIDSKQKERFLGAIKFYEEFIDKYPKSQSLKQAERIYEASNKELERIAKIEKEQKEASKESKTK